MRNLLLLFLLLGYFSTDAQDYKVNWSASQKKSKGTASLNVIGLQGAHYYYLETTKKESVIIQCDKNHKKISEQTLSIDYDKGIKMFSQVIDTKSGQYLYYVNWHRRNKIFQLLTAPFEDGKAGEIEKIYEQTFSTKEYLPFYLDKSTIKLKDCINEVLVSKEKNYVGFVNSYSLNDVNPLAINKDRKDPDKLELVVFDDKMNKVWSKTQSFDYQDRAISIYQADIDNEGNLYLLAKMTEHAEPKSKEGEYKVFVVTENDFKEFDIQLKEGFAPKALKISATDQKGTDFIITGFYGKKNEKQDYQGFLSIEGNKEQGISKIEQSDLTDIYSKFSISTEGDEKGRDYVVLENIFFEDGTLGVVVNIIDYYTSGKSGFEKVVSKGAIVVTLSEDRTVKAYTKIDFSSETPAMLIRSQGDNIYLLFDNSASKEELRKSDKSSFRSVQATNLVIVSKEGEKILNKRLFTGVDKDMHFKAYLSDINSNELLLGCWDVNKFAFGLVKL